MRPARDGGSRFGIVLNGSPLFTGGAGSGESEIRRYVLENDLLEAIIGLPTDMFYNTGISTYIWIVSNRKPRCPKYKDSGVEWLGEVPEKEVWFYRRSEAEPLMQCVIADLFLLALGLGRVRCEGITDCLVRMKHLTSNPLTHGKKTPGDSE